MKKRLLILIGILPILTGCYCKKYYAGTSSARFLHGYKARYICYDPPGIADGKSVLATVYTADNFYAHRFLNNERDKIMSDINFSNQYFVGLRAETFFKIGDFPGPLLGIGLDFSHNTYTANFYSNSYRIPHNETQILNQNRFNISLNYVTWIRDRMMGYICWQGGYEVSKNNINAQDIAIINTTSKKFNGRFGYGFQLYFKKAIAINVEAGYGGGAFIRGGISCWVF